MLRISLKIKLSVFLILLTLLPMLAAGIFSYRVLLENLTENTRSNELSILENQMMNFDLAMHNFETILNDLVTSESTQGFLQFRNDKESEIYYADLLLLTSKIDSLISQRGDALKMAAFLWNDGELPLLRGNSFGIDLSGDYTEREPFSGFLQADASIHWQVFREREGPVIYAYRTIYDASANQNIGVALINFLPGYFQELLARRMDSGAFCVLLDKEGNVVYTAGALPKELQGALQGGPSDGVFVTSRMPQLQSPEGARGVTPCKAFGGNYMVSYAASGVNGWKYVYFNPLTNIERSIHAIAWLVLTVIAVTAVLSILAALWLYHYLNAPIGRLSEAMARMEKGDLDTRVEIRRKDELGLLGDGFNEMAGKTKRLIQDIEKEQSEKRRMEIRFLQAQITPHFLYNTLNSIKALARLKRTEDISEMTTALIGLLRLSSGGEELIPLSRETEYVRNYVAIMSYRRSRAFRLETKLEPGTEKCLLPKFSLQPFVENSIIHGFSDADEGELQIELNAFFRDGELCVTVRDNGSGFDPEAVTERPEENGIRFSHVGMENVEERIRLYFGEGCGIRIDSAPGRGTLVTLRLPCTDDTEQKDKVT